MPFLGNEPSNTFVSIAKQTITGNGGTSYALAQAVANAADLDVYVNNIRQEPYVAYNASGTTITFTDAIASTDSVYWLFNGQTIGTLNVPSSSVGVGQLNTTEVDARYINVTGDTMTGSLQITDSTFNSALRLTNTGSGGQDWYLFSTMSAFTQGSGKLMAYNAGNGHPYDWAIDSAGRITMPYQPMFSAYTTATNTRGATGAFPYTHTLVNNGSHYNTSTYRFTAPINGNYHFSVSALLTSSAHVYLTKNGGAIGGSGAQAGIHQVGASYARCAVDCIVSLSAGDYVEAYQANTNGVYSDWNIFSGRLIG